VPSNNDPSASETPPTLLASPPRRQTAGRLKRLILKELREILRDRRTIVTLVVMPILIYPLLAIVFQRFLINAISVHENVAYDIGVDSEITQGILAHELQIGAATLERRKESDTRKRDSRTKNRAETPSEAQPQITLVAYPDETLRRHVADASLHLAAIYRPDRSNKSENGLHTPAKWELIYRAGSPTSEAAVDFVESRLQAFNEAALHEQMKSLGVRAELPAATTREPISFAGAPTFSLAALIPLILVLMTVTGAVYPAIDLTAGERERGTLETLIAAPVPRLGLLLAKYVAVLTVAILTALVNLIAMTITAHSSGLAGSLFGGGMTFDVVIKVLLLLVLFAAFFSAILLALTSYARSFKEAQAYIIPLMLLCLVPGILCLDPKLQFKSWMAVTPLVNIVMLGRDLLEGSAAGSLAIAAVCSTIFYIGAAIALAARIFGTDAILYGSPSTWSDLVRRPEESRPAASLATALLCLALMFPCYFVLASSLAQLRDLPMARRLLVSSIISAAILGGIPFLLARFNRVRLQTGLGLRRPGVIPLLTATVLGLALWPAAHEIYLLSEWLGLSALGSRQLAVAKSMIAQLRAVPLWLIITTMAVIPATFEELCFRGFLFGALRTRLSGAWTVVASALVFGIFHEILFPGRLLPSTFLGLVLGWVRLRTGSIVPGILLHALHNSLLLSIIYHQDELTARGWGIEEQQHLPIMWHAAALVAIVISATLLVITTRRPEKINESSAIG
jgi:ABC-2 type transport system permease protein/sodium transport system permease protein